MGAALGDGDSEAGPARRETADDRREWAAMCRQVRVPTMWGIPLRLFLLALALGAVLPALDRALAPPLHYPQARRGGRGLAAGNHLLRQGYLGRPRLQRADGRHEPERHRPVRAHLACLPGRSRHPVGAGLLRGHVRLCAPHRALDRGGRGRLSALGFDRRGGGHHRGLRRHAHRGRRACVPAAQPRRAAAPPRRRGPRFHPLRFHTLAAKLATGTAAGGRPVCRRRRGPRGTSCSPSASRACSTARTRGACASSSCPAWASPCRAAGSSSGPRRRWAGPSAAR